MVDRNTPPTTIQRHEFDDDACCRHCGFDGAEWSWLKRQGYCSGETQPLCIPRRAPQQHEEPRA
ncbi:hypothetical protein [Azohydromonas aeria]|uniref:hypothetical protein n=1 Tax=Azohydromonas aeria TaxID=2590212 RepID=UPI0012F96648|nr:hypothetical protein [Azohydromonas aeria]